MWLYDSRTKSGPETQVETQVEGDGALVEALRDQVTYLREQLDIRTVELREHRRLLAGLVERVPELEAPVEPPAPSQSREEAAQEPEGAAPKAPPGLKVRRLRTAHRDPSGEGGSAELRRSLRTRTSVNRARRKAEAATTPRPCKELTVSACYCCSGASPSCCRNPRLSYCSHSSTILLSSMRWMVMALSSTCLPVRGPSSSISPW
jgi:hypothetical protein